MHACITSTQALSAVALAERGERKGRAVDTPQDKHSFEVFVLFLMISMYFK